MFVRCGTSVREMDAYASSLLARKTSLIDVLGNSSLSALKLLQNCRPVFIKSAGFPANSLLFPVLQGIFEWRRVLIWLPPPPPSPAVSGPSWRRANSAELAGFARWNLVSGPGLDGETPGCGAPSLFRKFHVPAGV